MSKDLLILLEMEHGRKKEKEPTCACCVCNDVHPVKSVIRICVDGCYDAVLPNQMVCCVGCPVLAWCVGCWVDQHQNVRRGITCDGCCLIPTHWTMVAPIDMTTIKVVNGYLHGMCLNCVGQLLMDN